MRCVWGGISEQASGSSVLLFLRSSPSICGIWDESTCKGPHRERLSMYLLYVTLCLWPSLRSIQGPAAYNEGIPRCPGNTCPTPRGSAGALQASAGPGPTQSQDGDGPRHIPRAALVGRLPLPGPHSHGRISRHSQAQGTDGAQAALWVTCSDQI